MIRKRRSGAQWAALVSEQAKSGMGVRRFSEEHNCCPSTLYQWRKRLRRPVEESFIEVKVRPSIAADIVRSGPCARLKVGDSELSFEASADPRWVAAVVLATTGC